MPDIKQYEPLWGAWYIDSLLGAGSFGQVYKVRQEEFGKTYESAVKIITIPHETSEIRQMRSEGLDDKSMQGLMHSFVADIIREIDMMRQFRGHSHIVSLEDHQVIAKKDGIGWDILIRMELLTSLSQVIEQTPLSTAEVVKLGIHMCQALELCAQRNIIHRDIKPDNIFISPYGDYKLGDFGLARQLERTTSTLSKKGAYFYMAPEVFRGEHYDSSVDAYSLGIVMYRLLNQNRIPFLPDYPLPITPGDRDDALKKRLSGIPLPFIKGATLDLNAIVLKTCAFNRQERFSSPAEMRQALEDVATSHGYTGMAAGTAPTASPSPDVTTHMFSQPFQAPGTHPFAPDATIHMIPQFPQAQGTSFAPHHATAHIPPQSALPGQEEPWYNPAPSLQPQPAPQSIPGSAEPWQNPAAPFQVPSSPPSAPYPPSASAAPFPAAPAAANMYPSMPYLPNGSYTTPGNNTPKSNKNKLIAILGTCGGILAIGIVILIVVLTNSNNGSSGNGGNNGNGGNRGEISTQSPLIGTWENKEFGVEYTFNEGGTGTTSNRSNTGEFEYTINGDILTIQAVGGNNIVSEYSIAGNILTLKDPDSDLTLTFVKKGTSDNNNNSNNNNNTVTVDPALIGTWEAEDPFSTAVFVFNADGTGLHTISKDYEPYDIFYKTDGNTLRTESDLGYGYRGHPEEYTYSIEGNTLTLTRTPPSGQSIDDLDDFLKDIYQKIYIKKN